MHLHPAEIAQEIIAYPFFTNFHEALLLQIATMVGAVEYERGEVILETNSLNDKLFFLREGIVEILVEGEKVNELKTIGEVVGEMSVLSGKPVTAQIRAQTKVRCFFISAHDFAHVQSNQKDRFQFLLYKIYSGVLTDRLIKTNEKAKLYEITARELRIAKRELELVTAAQMNFLRSESSPIQQKVLLLEPNKKQQNVIKSAVGSTGVQIMIASTEEEAKKIFTYDRPNVIFCDQTSVEFLNWAHSQDFVGQSVLIGSSDLDFDMLLHLPFVQNVITRNPEDRASTVKSMLTTLSKILHQTYFGIEKYLAWGTDIKSIVIGGSIERDLARTKMLSHFKTLGIRGALLDRIQVAAEEMMMNAVYDAPVDILNQPLYNHLPRTTQVDLHASQRATLRFGMDGNLLAVSVQDPFGSLSREVIIKYLQSCYQNRAGEMNQDKGGAGRGLHQILESSDCTIFNIKPGEMTEVIGLFDVDQKVEGTPQFHYFFVK